MAQECAITGKQACEAQARNTSIEQYLANVVTPRLLAARKRCAAGIPPKVDPRSDAELREIAQGDGLGARLARAKLRMREFKQRVGA